MREIIDPIKTVFLQYCHVECYEVHELKGDMNLPAWKLDSSLFKEQLAEMLENPTEYVEGVNSITANEFENGDELKEWLEIIWSQVFE